MSGARYRVEGRVQGVGYRAFAARAARRLGLHGGASNELDGTVTVVAQGSQPALAELEAELAAGPTAARVTRVDRRPHVPRPEDRFDYEF